MNMIRKKPKVRSGIMRAPKREFPGHRQWIRTKACVIEGCQNPNVQCAHVRIGTDGGTGLKPHDKHTLPLCGPALIDGERLEGHHNEQHRIGEPAFERKYGIDLKAIAQEFARRSPHRAKWEQLEKEG